MTPLDDPPFPGLPGTAHEPRYSGRFVQALRVAALAHAGQIRKGTDVAPDGMVTAGIPYVAHPLGVCSIAQGYGADEDEAIAALLHDLLEDTLPTDAARATVARFGPRVVEIVEDCTDGVPDASGAKESSGDRKARYLERIEHHGRSSLLVSASDKLHNARSTVADLRVLGDRTWAKFSVPREAQLAYYAELAEKYHANPAHHPPLVAELDRTVAEMHRLAGATYRRPTDDEGAGA